MTRTGMYLGISIALNVFMLGSIGGAVFWLTQKDRMIMAGTLRMAGSELPIKERRAFRKSLREARSAMADKLETAREARLRASELLRQPVVDVAATSAALDQARAAEVEVRSAIEHRALDFVSNLPPEDRAALAKAMERRGAPKTSRSD